MSAQLGWRRSYLFIIAACLACFSCKGTSDLAPLPPVFSVFDPPKVPVILVGQALENCHPVAPAERSKWNDRPVQLWTVRERVERVLQGEVRLRNVTISYFVDQGFSTGPWSRLLNISEGQSNIFFLQPDGNRLRTICDGWRSCVLPVLTGTHYGSSIDRNLPIEDIMVNLLLSRGDSTTDAQMIRAIEHPEARWGWTPVINRLEQLAKQDTSSQVRSVALSELGKLRGYYGKGTRTVDRVP